MAGFWSAFPLDDVFFTEDLAATVFAVIALEASFTFGFALFEAMAFLVSATFFVSTGVAPWAGLDLLELVVVFATAFV